jgi:RNA polymerase sigma factor (TIGR02999 family)
MSSEHGDVTVLLGALRQGAQDAESQLLPLVYRELRQLALSYLRRERSDHTMQATDLVHEAYMRMVGDVAPAQDRTHFFALAAKVMRQVLVDHARAHRAAKRNDGKSKLPLDEALALSNEYSQQLLDLDEALSRLAEIDVRQARVVEMRYFAGMSVDETAQALGVAGRTVNREWRLAKAWLRRELSNEASP